MSDSLTGIFRRTVKRFGSRPALIAGNETLSYKDLDSRSDEIAATLQRAGIKPGARVGIFRRKNIDTVASIYAILKTGCAYVPIDTKMGSNRLAAVLDDAGLAALIVEPGLAQKVQALITTDLCPWLAESEKEDDILRLSSSGSGSSSSLELASGNRNSAYILYTSGSTGIPKGVQHTHESAMAFVSWAADEFNISCDDRLSCQAPLNFDLTIFDLFVGAMTGASVVLIPDDLAMFPLPVASIIENEEITVWYSVPFALIQLVKHGNLAGRRLALREIIFAGERFPPAQLRELAAVLSGVRLTNLFGPTETNVCTYHHLSPDDIASDEFCPIGEPCPYASVAVIDERGADIAPGEIGELLVGGSSVMTGYLNRPELNEKVFVNRIDDGTPQRYFCTGDLVRTQESGPMRFCGRVDRQTKVRGFRIELDEIEAALANCAGVIAAAAWVESDSNGYAEVRAAVATDPASQPTSDSLITAIRSYLPQAAIPTQVIVLADLPRSVNGKVDYASLSKLASAD